MTCRHFQRLLRSSVQMSVEGAPSTLLRLVLSNSCSKKCFGTSPAKFKLELSNLYDVFYHRSYIVSIKNITRLSCTPGLVQLLYRCLEFFSHKRSSYHRSTRANTPDSAPFRRFLLFSPWWAPAHLRLKKQKSLENPSLSGAGSFAGAEMRPDKERPAENTCRIVKGLDAVWAHFCPSKPCLPLSSDGKILGNC